MCGSAPKTPDPDKVSAAQTQSNKDTAAYNAQLNRVNQTNPFGSSSYSQTGTDPTTGAPIYNQSTTLSPQLQALFDSQTSSQQGISDAIGGAIGRLPGQAFDPSGIDVGDIRQRSFDSQMALMAPQFDKGWKQLEGTMSDRGLPIGSEIFNDQLGEYNRARDTSILGAGRTADLDASNEFQRQYGNKLNEYNMPYDALGKLMGNSSAVGSPQFSGVPQSAAAGTDTAQNTWNAYNANVAANNQSNSNLMSGLLGIGKLGLGVASGGSSFLLPGMQPGMNAFG